MSFLDRTSSTITFSKKLLKLIEKKRLLWLILQWKYLAAILCRIESAMPNLTPWIQNFKIFESAPKTLNLQNAQLLLNSQPAQRRALNHLFWVINPSIAICSEMSISRYFKRVCLNEHGQYWSPKHRCIVTK